MPPVDLDRRHYQAILDRRTIGDDHPIDLLIARLPEIATIDQTLHEFAREMHVPTVRRAQERWIEYEDLRLLQRTIRQERFFDVGFEFGRIAGITEDQFVSKVEGLRELRDVLRDVVLQSGTARTWAVAVLLETARALALDRPVDRGGQGST
jgi:hypothetical protein